MGVDTATVSGRFRRLDNVWIVLVVLLLEMGGWRSAFVGTWGVGNIYMRFIEIHITMSRLVLR